MLWYVVIAVNIVLYSVQVYLYYQKTKQVRVYCCGVFDMCHLGHMQLFRRAKQYCNYLLVGVHTDKDVESYKRTPYVDEKTRYETVFHCKNVDKVIPAAPLVLTQEFLKEHKIDIVVLSSEYDYPDDHYYAAARKLGIARVLDRYEGISTTDIIKKVKNN